MSRMKKSRKVKLVKLPERTEDRKRMLERVAIFMSHRMQLIDGEWYYEEEVEPDADEKDKPPTV